jgi:hypothetical protein
MSNVCQVYIAKDWTTDGRFDTVSLNRMYLI